MTVRSVPGSRLALALLVLVALAGCGLSKPETPARIAHYACDGGFGFRARYNDDSSRVALFFRGREPVVLDRKPSASGVTYADERYEFWAKGDKALWTVKGRRPTGCLINR